MKKSVFLTTLSCLLSASIHAQQPEMFKAEFPQFWLSTQQRHATNQFFAIGEATFQNNVKVPMYGVTVENPADEGLLREAPECNPKQCTFDFKLDAKHAEKLKLLFLPGIGLTLMPRDWQEIEAGLGANGTASVLMINPKLKEAMSLYDSSMCVGCGLPNASLYFPQLAKQSLENEFGAYSDPHRRLTLVYPNAHTAYFSYQIPNQNNKTHGIATYYDEDTFNFQEIKLTLDQSRKDLATPILNFYKFSHQ